MMIQSYDKHTIRDALNEAYACGTIDDQQLRQLLEQLRGLLHERVLRFNNGNSTSLSQADWHRICHSLDHLFAHGYRKEMLDRDIYMEGMLKKIIFGGLYQVRKDIREIKGLSEELRVQLPEWQNVEYRALFARDIPDLMRRWRAGNDWLAISENSTDLLYPLIGGSFAMRDDQDAAGSDLVLYYLRCLALEQEFCCLFRSEITILSERFQAERGKPLEELNISLGELLMDQALAAMMINGRRSVLLEQEGIILLKDRLRRCPSILAEVEKQMRFLLASVSPRAAAYFLSYVSQFAAKFTMFADQEYDFLIGNASLQQRHKLVFRRYGDPSQAVGLMHRLNGLFDIKKISEQISAAELSVFDLMDVLDQLVLKKAEYAELFACWDEEGLAVLLEALMEEQGVETISDLKESDRPWAEALAVWMEDTSSTPRISALMRHLEISWQ